MCFRQRENCASSFRKMELLMNLRISLSELKFLCTEPAPVDLNCLSGKSMANQLRAHTFGIYIPTPGIKLYF